MSYSNLQIFLVELIGTFILVVFATGSIVYDVQTGGTLGIAFAAIAPFVALIIGIYSFGKISYLYWSSTEFSLDNSLPMGHHLCEQLLF